MGDNKGMLSSCMYLLIMQDNFRVTPKHITMICTVVCTVVGMYCLAHTVANAPLEPGDTQVSTKPGDVGGLSFKLGLLRLKGRSPLPSICPSAMLTAAPKDCLVLADCPRLLGYFRHLWGHELGAFRERVEGSTALELNHSNNSVGLSVALLELA